MMKNLFPFIFCTMLLGLCSSCDKTRMQKIDIDAEILKEMQALEIPSVVACIVDSNDIIWSGNYGYANKEYAIPATNETFYLLQSISKLVLSVTVFQLWENGQIDLNEDINSYLPFDVRNPNYPDSAITTAMLLNHTSGLAWPAPEEYMPDFHQFFSHEEPPLLIDWIPEYIFPGGEYYRTFVWKVFS